MKLNCRLFRNIHATLKKQLGSYCHRRYCTTWVSLKGRDFLSLKDFKAVEIEQMLWTALDLKTRHKDGGQKISNVLNGKSVTIVSGVPSIRTKASVSHATSLTNGSVSVLSCDDMKCMKDGYSFNEIGRSIGAISDVVAIRLDSHDEIEKVADESLSPVINLSSDLYHPIKALSYLFTWLEEFEYLRGLKVAWIGQNCNLINSLMFASGHMGIKLKIGTPVGHEPEPSHLMQVIKSASSKTFAVDIEHDVAKAAYRADVIIGGAWTNHLKKEKRFQDFSEFTITQKIFEERSAVGKFMHELPWSEMEVSENVMMNGDNLTWAELQNRKFAAMAVLVNLLTDYVPVTDRPSFERNQN